MASGGTPSRTFASQRASPFRRPESPLGRSPTTVAPTPQGSPLKQSTPSKSKADMPATTAGDRSWMQPASSTSPALSPSKSPIPFALASRAEPKRELPMPPAPSSTTAPTRPTATRSTTGTGSKTADPLSSIPPHHLHTMRESFSVLDRANTGALSASDVATALAELGLDSSPRTLATYFPSGITSLNLGAYLAVLTQDLTRLSRQDELAAAFAAFDDDDSGQIDVAELRDALLGMATEDGQMMSEREVDGALDGFVGRRVLQKGQTGHGLGGGKREVFRYGDFSTSIWGGGPADQQSVRT